MASLCWLGRYICKKHHSNNKNEWLSKTLPKTTANADYTLKKQYCLHKLLVHLKQNNCTLKFLFLIFKTAKTFQTTRLATNNFEIQYLYFTRTMQDEKLQITVKNGTFFNVSTYLSICVQRNI